MLKHWLLLGTLAIACALFFSGGAGLAAEQGGPVAVGQGQLATGGVVLVQAPSPQQAPGAVIDTGTLAGQALTWVVTTFGGTIGLTLTTLLYRMLQRKNIELSEKARERLQEIIVNGLNLGAAEIAKRMEGKGQIDVKNAVVASTIGYVQDHGVETLKKLGIDPTSPQAISAIRARIESAIIDPDTPTHPLLDGAKPAAT